MKANGFLTAPGIPLQLAISLCICLQFATTTQSAVLSSVPMQGGMLMPSVSYQAAADRATVDLSNIGLIAQLTPLLVSNPKDSFDPSAPWFDDLDPSRQGLAFSRRYGFNMDPNTDLLPANRALWIRKTAGSPHLGIYDYNASSSPKLWAPILGTAGSSNATSWSGLMWHVGITAPPGTNTYSATFEVYVLNTATRQEIPGSSSGPFTLHWTCVPDGRPQLNIVGTGDNGPALTWPAAATNWALVSSTNLFSGPWVPVNQEPMQLEGQASVQLSGSMPQQFYRLQRNP